MTILTVFVIRLVVTNK